MPLDLTRLQVFSVVAAAGSVSRGATLLRMQQSTVSRSIAALEEEFGAPLFERRARGVSLTEKGQRLLEASAPHLSALERSISEAFTTPAGPGILPLGASEVIATALLPEVHTQLFASDPQTSPYVLVAPSDVLVERVRGGGLDFALVMHARRAPGIGIRSLLPLRHFLVIGAAWADDRRILARFIGSREVEDPGNRQFPTLDRLRSSIPEATITASCNSLSAHKAMVLAGQGVSVLPEFLVRAELRTGTLVAVWPEPMAFPMLCLSRTGTVWTRRARRYLEIVEERLQLPEDAGSQSD